MIYYNSQLAAAALVIATMVLCIVAMVFILLLFRRATAASRASRWDEHQTFLFVKEARNVIDHDQIERRNSSG